MAKRLDAVRLLSRREAAGSIFLAVGGAVLFACGAGVESEATDGDGTGSGDGTGTGADGATTADGSTTADGGTGAASEWASGGTAAMTGSYPDPFPTLSTACVLAATATPGPCTEAADQVRKDISEGFPGLPMRLALRVVDGDCNPIEGAKVKVWHTQITGSYSGDTPNNDMCLKNQADSAKHYFRGVQTSDAAGRVDFDSCFPGWYRGRAVHIHFTVSLGSKSYTSQLVFDQALVQEIFENHPEYAAYGQPDTSNATDNIVGGGNLASYTLAASRMSDGAMLAVKELVVDVT